MLFAPGIELAFTPVVFLKDVKLGGNMLQTLSGSRLLKSNHTTLNEISEQLRSNYPTVRLEGFFKLTKTEKSYCNALLKRDFTTEESVNALIDKNVGWNILISRYETLNDNSKPLVKPKHYAARILEGFGSMVSGKNIFLFFPECLSVKNTHLAFGIEFIDLWSNIFTSTIFPCARTVLSRKTCSEMLPSLNEQLKESIYMASVFHELGHQVGPYKVSPVKDSRNLLSAFYLDVLGELATDSLLVYQLKEFPNVASFVLLQRLFWFPRRGFMDNPLSAQINLDNDSWIGAFLWNELLNKKVMEKENNQWVIHWKILPSFFKNLFDEIDQLGQKILKQDNTSTQDKQVMDWMKSKVEYDEDLGFLFHPEQIRAYQMCSRHPEIPHFQTLLDI